MNYSLGAIALLAVAGILLFNTMIRRKNAVAFAFAAIDVMLKKRYDLIPNLVSICEEHMGYEQKVLREVTATRARVMQAGDDERVRMYGTLASQLKSVFAVAEDYPVLRASESFDDLQRALTEVEEQIAAARRPYNAAVLAYNNACEMVPTNIAAHLMGTMKTLLSILCCSLAIALAPASRADSPPPAVGEVVNIPVQPQAWQARRGEFARILNSLDSKDPSTLRPFEAVLTEFEQQPFSRTPMENMEILGVYYLPREGIEAILTYIAANAALGWYDALRYGSESGQSEIQHNEGFFKLPFVLAGEEFAGQAVKFFEEQPEKTAQLVQQGIAIADSLKDDPRYDHQWPSAYGLERMMCAMGGECSPPSAMPKAQWGEAWKETKARVVRYYRINPPPASAPASAPKKATPAKTKKR